jgi:hypothetical protein
MIERRVLTNSEINKLTIDGYDVGPKLPDIVLKDPEVIKAKEYVEQHVKNIVRDDPQTIAEKIRMITAQIEQLQNSQSDIPTHITNKLLLYQHLHAVATAVQRGEFFDHDKCPTEVHDGYDFIIFDKHTIFFKALTWFFDEPPAQLDRIWVGSLRVAYDYFVQYFIGLMAYECTENIRAFILSDQNLKRLYDEPETPENIRTHIRHVFGINIPIEEQVKHMERKSRINTTTLCDENADVRRYTTRLGHNFVSIQHELFGFVERRFNCAATYLRTVTGPFFNCNKAEITIKPKYVRQLLDHPMSWTSYGYRGVERYKQFIPKKPFNLDFSEVRWLDESNITYESRMIQKQRDIQDIHHTQTVHNVSDIVSVDFMNGYAPYAGLDQHSMIDSLCHYAQNWVSKILVVCNVPFELTNLIKEKMKFPYCITTQCGENKDSTLAVYTHAEYRYEIIKHQAYEPENAILMNIGPCRVVFVCSTYGMSIKHATDNYAFQKRYWKDKNFKTKFIDRILKYKPDVIIGYIYYFDVQHTILDRLKSEGYDAQYAETDNFGMRSNWLFYKKEYVGSQVVYPWLLSKCRPLGFTFDKNIFGAHEEQTAREEQAAHVNQFTGNSDSTMTQLIPRDEYEKLSHVKNVIPVNISYDIHINLQDEQFRQLYEYYVNVTAKKALDHNSTIFLEYLERVRQYPHNIPYSIKEIDGYQYGIFQPDTEVFSVPRDFSDMVSDTIKTTDAASAVRLLERRWTGMQVFRTKEEIKAFLINMQNLEKLYQHITHNTHNTDSENVKADTNAELIDILERDFGIAISLEDQINRLGVVRLFDRSKCPDQSAQKTRYIKFANKIPLVSYITQHFKCTSHIFPALMSPFIGYSDSVYVFTAEQLERCTLHPLDMSNIAYDAAVEKIKHFKFKYENYNFRVVNWLQSYDTYMNIARHKCDIIAMNVHAFEPIIYGMRVVEMLDVVVAYIKHMAPKTVALLEVPRWSLDRLKELPDYKYKLHTPNGMKGNGLNILVMTNETHDMRVVEMYFKVQRNAIMLTKNNGEKLLFVHGPISKSLFEDNILIDPAEAYVAYKFSERDRRAFIEKVIAEQPNLIIGDLNMTPAETWHLEQFTSAGYTIGKQNQPTSVFGTIVDYAVYKGIDGVVHLLDFPFSDHRPIGFTFEKNSTNVVHGGHSLTAPVITPTSQITPIISIICIVIIFLMFIIYSVYVGTTNLLYNNIRHRPLPTTYYSNQSIYN